MERAEPIDPLEVRAALVARGYRRYRVPAGATADLFYQRCVGEVAGEPQHVNVYVYDPVGRQRATGYELEARFDRLGPDGYCATVRLYSFDGAQLLARLEAAERALAAARVALTAELMQ